MRIINGLQPHTGQNYKLHHLTEFANKKYREFVQLIMPMRGPPFLPKLRKLGQSYQVLHKLEKYLNIQDCHENKICLEKYLKNTQRPCKFLEYYHLQEDSTRFGGLNQYKIMVPLFGAAYAASNKDTIILHLFSNTNTFSNGL